MEQQCSPEMKSSCNSISSKQAHERDIQATFENELNLLLDQNKRKIIKKMSMSLTEPVLPDRQTNFLFVRKLHEQSCEKFIVQAFDLIVVKHRCQLFLDKLDMRILETIIQPDIINEHKSGLMVFDVGQHEFLIDFVIILGGDGTLLFAMNHFQHRKAPPTLAFAKGTLCFMCNYQEEQFQEVIDNLFIRLKTQDNQLRVESKMRIHAELKLGIDAHGFDADSNKLPLPGFIMPKSAALQQSQSQEDILCIQKCNTISHNRIASQLVLNEVIIDRGANPYPITMEIYINDELFTTSSGDGIIVSTPTGSTAYSLSAGGPIVNNSVRALLLVPICPLSLSFRPILLPEHSKIQVKLVKNKAYYSGDGRNMVELEVGDLIEILASDFDVPLIVEQNNNLMHNWSKKLRQMLNWNMKFIVNADIHQRKLKQQQKDKVQVEKEQHTSNLISHINQSPQNFEKCIQNIHIEGENPFVQKIFEQISTLEQQLLQRKQSYKEYQIKQKKEEEALKKSIEELNKMKELFLDSGTNVQSQQYK